MSGDRTGAPCSFYTLCPATPGPSPAHMIPQQWAHSTVCLLQGGCAAAVTQHWGGNLERRFGPHALSSLFPAKAKNFTKAAPGCKVQIAVRLCSLAV